MARQNASRIMHSVHWGINPTPSKTPPSSFLPSYTIDLQTVQATPLPILDNLPHRLVFCEPPLQPHPTPKNWIFSVNPQTIKVFYP